MLTGLLFVLVGFVLVHADYWGWRDRWVILGGVVGVSGSVLMMVSA